jgi:hypothetical protein
LLARRPSPTGTLAAVLGARSGRIALLLSLIVGLLAGPAPASTRHTVPGTGCTVFPASNIWNIDISKLPVHPKSRVWLRTMEAGSTLLHPDFGAAPYGLPFAVVGPRHRMVRIRFTYGDESDRVRYPFGPDIPLERGSDRHALIIRKDTCKLYELYAADWNGGNPRAGSGAVFDLASNALRPDGDTSADAAGLPIFPGLVRYDEVKAGSIDHAIRFTADLTRDQHVWPARHDAGHPNPDYPPMGARFRLKAGYDLSRFSPKARVILKAMKRYGMVLADNGANFFFQGTMDRRWSNRLLDQLKTVPASAFVAVDVSSCRVHRDSGEARCPA